MRILASTLLFLIGISLDVSKNSSAFRRIIAAQIVRLPRQFWVCCLTPDCYFKVIGRDCQERSIEYLVLLLGLA